MNVDLGVETAIANETAEAAAASAVSAAAAANIPATHNAAHAEAEDMGRHAVWHVPGQWRPTIPADGSDSSQVPAQPTLVNSRTTISSHPNDDLPEKEAKIAQDEQAQNAKESHIQLAWAFRKAARSWDCIQETDREEVAIALKVCAGLFIVVVVVCTFASAVALVSARRNSSIETLPEAYSSWDKLQAVQSGMPAEAWEGRQWPVWEGRMDGESDGTGWRQGAVPGPGADVMPGYGPWQQGRRSSFLQHKGKTQHHEVDPHMWQGRLVRAPGAPHAARRDRRSSSKRMDMWHNHTHNSQRSRHWQHRR